MTKTVTKPTIKRRDMDAVLSCLVDDSIGPGEYSELLVKQAASVFGTSGGLALREYPRAIEVAIDSLGLEPESRVLLSPLAPSAYAAVLAHRGLVAEYSDVDIETGTLTVEAVSAAIAGECSAVILDSPLGIIPDLEALQDLPIPIVEDVSYSFGATAGELQSGSCGKIVLFHLEEDGVITGGGGAIVLGRHARAAGDINSAAAHLSETSLLANMNASLAATQLKHVAEFAERRKSIAKVYRQAISRGKHRSPGDEGDRGTDVRFAVVLDGSIRDAAKFARSKGVSTREPFLDSIFVRSDFDVATYPNAASFAMRTLLFPLYPMLKRDEVDRVARVLASLP